MEGQELTQAVDEYLSFAEEELESKPVMKDSHVPGTTGKNTANQWYPEVGLKMELHGREQTKINLPPSGRGDFDGDEVNVWLPGAEPGSSHFFDAKAHFPPSMTPDERGCGIKKEIRLPALSCGAAGGMAIGKPTPFITTPHGPILHYGDTDGELPPRGGDLPDQEAIDVAVAQGDLDVTDWLDRNRPYSLPPTSPFLRLCDRK